MVDKDELKKKAIKRLSEKGKIPDNYDIEQLNNHEMKRIIEDLVIHQMELEIQNENMARLQIELANSRNKYYRLFENSPTGFLTLDMQGVVRELNKSAATIIEKQKKNLQAKPFTLFVDQTDHSNFFSNLRTAKQKGKKAKNEILMKNNKTVIFESLFVEEESEVFYLVSITDISEKKEIERKMIQARAVAEEATKAKSIFLANMSHEIRNPLNEIAGAIELIEGAKSEEEKEKLLYIAKNSSEMLTNLIDDVLDLSKIEANKLFIQRKVVNLNQLLTNVISSYKLSCHKKGITLTLMNQLDKDTCCLTDDVRLRQILNNLLSNAIKFTDTGSIILTVSNGENNKIYFSIKDSGVGMDEDEQSKLFSDFYQTRKKNKTKTGTGLGLAISKRLVQLLDGDISVESILGKGSNFAFNIVAPKVDCGKDSVTEEKPSKSIKDLKVLIAEDNPINQVILSKMIERFGCSVQVVSNASAVLEKIVEQKETFDILFLDIQLPDYDGYYVTDKIRENEMNTENELCIVGVSAHATKEHKTRAFEAGMNDYLTKPVTGERILAVCKKNI